MITLTSGERLMIARVRQKRTQLQEAKQYGVSYQQYSRWERDVEREGDLKPPRPAIGKVTNYERCLVHRRRAGKAQRDVAAEMGFCPFTIRKMESGAIEPDRLIEYWEA